MNKRNKVQHVRHQNYENIYLYSKVTVSTYQENVSIFMFLKLFIPIKSLKCHILWNFFFNSFNLCHLLLSACNRHTHTKFMYSRISGKIWLLGRSQIYESECIQVFRNYVIYILFSLSLSVYEYVCLFRNGERNNNKETIQNCKRHKEFFLGVCIFCVYGFICAKLLVILILGKMLRSCWEQQMYQPIWNHSDTQSICILSSFLFVFIQPIHLFYSTHSVHQLTVSNISRKLFTL